MSIPRSGIPVVVEGTVDAAPSDQEATIIVDTPTTWVLVQNRGPAELKVYFTLADFSADRRFITVAASGERELPLELFGNRGIFLRGVGGSADYTVLAAQRVL